MADLEGAPTVIASYNYEDIEDLGGTLKYYFYIAQDNTGEQYLLGKDNPYSVVNGLDTSAATETWTWDTGAFTTTRVIGGTSTVNMTVHTQGDTGGTATLTYNLYHYDGSTETLIGTAITGNLGGGVSPITQSVLNKIVITPTRFKRGDTLRLKIVWAQSYGAGQKLVRYGTDPQNRDFTDITPSTDADEFTSSYIMIPFRIDD